MSISLIVTEDNICGIGKNNQFAWSIDENLTFYNNLTIGNCVVMGRNTWDTISPNNRGLSNRINIILSSTLTQEQLNSENVTGAECHIASNIEQVFSIHNQYGPGKDLYIMGGSLTYKQFFNITEPKINTIYITRLNKDYECDILFPHEDFLRFLGNNTIESEKVVTSTMVMDNLNNIMVEYEINKIQITSNV
jgi:dihydrofolate reductase